MKKWPPLKYLELEINQAGIDFIEEAATNDAAINVYMTFNGMRTHQIKLHADSCILYWKVISGISYSFQFKNILDARKWWMKFITPKIRNHEAR